ASHDGFQNNTFNNKCESQGSCLVVTKCNETNKIIGGYTSVGFIYQNGFYADSQSFLFSFDFNEITNPTICHVQSYSHALYNDYDDGYFIFNFGYGDLMMDNNIISCDSGNDYYKKVDLLNNNTNNFNASEIEAFKVQFNS
ncbi:5732_t:CDS:2, partial [Entrophospora sp. SA101]